MLVALYLNKRNLKSSNFQDACRLTFDVLTCPSETAATRSQLNAWSISYRNVADGFRVLEDSVTFQRHLNRYWQWQLMTRYYSIIDIPCSGGTRILEQTGIGPAAWHA